MRRRINRKHLPALVAAMKARAEAERNYLTADAVAHALLTGYAMGLGIDPDTIEGIDDEGAALLLKPTEDEPPVTS